MTEKENVNKETGFNDRVLISSDNNSIRIQVFMLIMYVTRRSFCSDN